MIPQGSVSVEVYADSSTKAEEMLAEAFEMSSWIPNAHIKFPSTKEGLKAAERAVKANLRVNMTLCFQQEQAAAVYSATSGSKKGMCLFLLLWGVWMIWGKMEWILSKTR